MDRREMEQFASDSPCSLERGARRLAGASRVLVLGPSGAGKTHLAQRLGVLLGLEVVHLDAHFWKAGWVPTEAGTWRDAVAGLVQRPAWIMDGTYEGTLDLRVPAADVIIVVERACLGCLWGVFRRCVLFRGRPRADAPPGQRIDRAFLRYIVRYASRSRPVILRRIEDCDAGGRVVWVRGGRGVERFLTHVRETLARPGGPGYCPCVAEAIQHLGP